LPTVIYTKYDASGLLQVSYTQEYSYNLSTHDISKFSIILQKTQTYVDDPNPEYITDFSGEILTTSVDSNLNNIAQATVAVPFYHNMSFNVRCVTTFQNGDILSSLPVFLENSYDGYKNAAQANPPSISILNKAVVGRKLTFDVSYSVVLQHFINGAPDYGSIDRLSVNISGVVEGQVTTIDASSNLLQYSQNASGDIIGSYTYTITTNDIIPQTIAAIDGRMIYPHIEIRTFYRDNTTIIQGNSEVFEVIDNNPSNIIINLMLTYSSGAQEVVPKRLYSIPLYNISTLNVIRLETPNPFIEFGQNSLPVNCEVICNNIPYLQNATCTYIVSAPFVGGPFINYIKDGSAKITSLNIQPVQLVASIPSGFYSNANISGILYAPHYYARKISLGTEALPANITLFISGVDTYITNTRITFTYNKDISGTLLYNLDNNTTSVNISKYDNNKPYLLTSDYALTIPSNSFIYRSNISEVVEVTFSSIEKLYLANNSLPLNMSLRCNDSFLDNAKATIVITSQPSYPASLLTIWNTSTKTLTKINSSLPFTLKDSIAQLNTNGYLRNTNLTHLNLRSSSTASQLTIQPNSLPLDCQISVGTVSDSAHNPTLSWNNDGNIYSNLTYSMVYTNAIATQAITRFWGIFYKNIDTNAEILWIPVNIRDTASSPTSVILPETLSRLPNWFRATDIDVWYLPNNSFSVGYFDEFVTSRKKDISFIYYNTTYILKKGMIGLIFGSFPANPTGMYAILGNEVSTYRLPLDESNYKKYINTVPTITNLIIPATRRTLPVIGWDNYFTFARNELPNNQIYTFYGIKWKNSQNIGGARIVDIPSTVTVVHLMPGAFDLYPEMFKNNKTIQTIKYFTEFRQPPINIPADFANGCTSLKSLEIVPYNLIDARAFMGCSSLPTTLTLTPSVDFIIGEKAYSNCTSISDITIQAAGNLTINSKAFENCTGLKNIIFDCNGTLTIATDAFTGCSGVENVAIRNCHTNMPWLVNRTSLKSINLAIRQNSTVNLDSLSNSINLETVTLTGGAVTLASNAFQGCSKLRTVAITSTLQNTAGVSVPADAFTGCTALTTVSLSLINSVATTCSSTFSGLASLTSVSLTGGRVALPTNAFSSCSALTTLTLNCSLTNSFGSTAFQGCTALTALTLPFATDAAATFAAPLTSYSSLQTLALTGGVTVTPTNFLQGCSALRNLTIRGILSGSIHPSLLLQIYNITLRSTTPQTVAEYSYMNNTNLRTFDVAPIRSIGAGAFFGCTNLQSITLPEGLTEIGDWAFLNTGISGEVVVPSTVVSLGQAYFVGCPNLRKLTYRCPVLMFKDPTQTGADMWDIIHRPSTMTLDISGVTVVTKGTDPSLNVTYIDTTSHTLTHGSLYSNLNLEKYKARGEAFETIIRALTPIYGIVSDPSNNHYDLSSTIIVGTQINFIRSTASLCMETLGPVSSIAEIANSFSQIASIAATVGKQANITAAETAYSLAVAANTDMYSTPVDASKVLSVPVPTTLPPQIKLPLENIKISRIVGENLLDLCGGVLYSRYNLSNLVIGMYDATIFDISGSATLNIDTHLGENAAIVMKYLFLQDTRLDNNKVNFSFTGSLTSIYLLDDKTSSIIDISSQTVTITDFAMDTYMNSSVYIKADYLKIYNNAFNGWNSSSINITSTSDIIVGKDIFLNSNIITVSANKPLVNTPQIKMIDFGSSTILDISGIIWTHTGVPEGKIRDLNISTYIPKENPGFVRGYCMIKFQDIDTLKEHVLIAQPEDWFWCYRGIFSTSDFGGGPKDEKYNITNTDFKYVDESTSGLTNSFAPEEFTYNGYRFTRKATSSKSTNNNVTLRAVKTSLSKAKGIRARDGIIISFLLMLKDIAIGIAAGAILTATSLIPGVGPTIFALVFVGLVAAQVTASIALTNYITGGKFTLGGADIDGFDIALEVLTALVGFIPQGLAAFKALKAMKALKIAKPTSLFGSSKILMRTLPQPQKLVNLKTAALERVFSSISNLKNSVSRQTRMFKKRFSERLSRSTPAGPPLSKEISAHMITERAIPNSVQYARAASMRSIPVVPRTATHIPAHVSSSVVGRASAKVRIIVTKVPEPKLLRPVAIDKSSILNSTKAVSRIRANFATSGYLDDSAPTTNAATQLARAKEKVVEMFGKPTTIRRSVDTLLENIVTEAFNYFGVSTDRPGIHSNWDSFLAAALQHISLSSDPEQIGNALSYIYRLHQADFSSAYDANVIASELQAEESGVADAFSNIKYVTLHQLATYNTIDAQPSIAVTETLGYNTIIDDDMETSILTAGQVDVPPYIFPMVSEEADGENDTEDKIYYFYRHGTSYSHKYRDRNNNGNACRVITTANPLLTMGTYLWRDTYLGGPTSPGDAERDYQGYVTDPTSIINNGAPHVILAINNDNNLLYLGTRKVEYTLSDYEMPNNVFCGAENMTVIIPEGVTDISSYAFCSTDGTDGEIPFTIDTLVLPSTIRAIHRKAFYRASVKNVLYPSTIKYIGRSVFENCGLVNALATYTDREYTTAQSVSIATLPTTEIVHNSQGSIIFRGFNNARVTTATGSTVILPGTDSTGTITSISITSSSYDIKGIELVIINSDNDGDNPYPRLYHDSTIAAHITKENIGIFTSNILYGKRKLEYTEINGGDGVSYLTYNTWENARHLKHNNGWRPRGNYDYTPDLYFDVQRYHPQHIITLGSNPTFNFTTPSLVTYNVGYVVTRSRGRIRDISEPAVIEPGAFAGNTTLETVTFPDNTVSIGSNAFDGCTALRTVEVPDTVTEIQEAAFANSGLTTIAIPSSVTTIGSNIFQGVSDELNVVFTDETPPPAVATIISQLPPTTTIYVPQAAVSTFTTLVADTALTVVADAPASAPTSVAVASANNSLVVSWSPPTSTGGSPITSYTVYYTPAGGMQTAITNASTPQTIIGLTNRTTYSIQVVAMKPIGAGTLSTAVSGTPLPNGPTAFTNILPDSYADGNGGTRYFTHYFDLSAGITAVNMWASTDANAGSNASCVRLYSATAANNLLDESHTTVVTDASLNSGTLTLASNLNNTSRNHNVAFNGLQASTRHYIISKTTNDVSGQRLGIAMQTLAGTTVPLTFVKTSTIINTTTGLVSGTDTSLTAFTVDGTDVSDGATISLRNKSSVTVVATPTDPDATVAISGATGLSDGSNNLLVTVTAADGTTTQAYTVILIVVQNTISSSSQSAINALASSTITSAAIQTIATNVLSDIAANSSNKTSVISNFITAIKASSDINARTKVGTALSVAMKVPATNNSLKATFNNSFQELGLISNIAYDLEETETAATVASVDAQFKRSGYSPTSLAVIIPDTTTNALTIDLNKSDLVLSFVPGVTYTVNALYGNTTSTNSYTISYTRSATTRYLTVNGAEKSLNSTFTFDFSDATSRYVKIEVTGSIIISNGPVENTPVCFLANAPVLTPTGYRRIDSLQVGDLIQTADGRAVSIQRIKTVVAAPGPLSTPYIIPAGRFGATVALPISPRHRVAVPGRGLVEARDIGGLSRLPMREHWTYYNIGLPSWKSDNLVVAGVEVESLAPVERIRMTLAEFREALVKKYGASVSSKAVMDCVLATCRLGADGMVEAPVIRRK
jgi:hypothetical protein